MRRRRKQAEARGRAAGPKGTKTPLRSVLSWIETLQLDEDGCDALLLAVRDIRRHGKEPVEEFEADAVRKRAQPKSTDEREADRVAGHEAYEGAACRCHTDAGCAVWSRKTWRTRGGGSHRCRCRLGNPSGEDWSQRHPLRQPKKHTLKRSTALRGRSNTPSTSMETRETRLRPTLLLAL